MSYILESLKKSDQQRKRGSVPGLLSDHGENGPGSRPPHRRSWPYLLGGALLLVNVAAFALWLQPWQSAETVTAVSAPPVVAADRQEIAAGAVSEQASPDGPDREGGAAESPALPAAADVVLPLLEANVEGGGDFRDSGIEQDRVSEKVMSMAPGTRKTEASPALPGEEASAAVLREGEGRSAEAAAAAQKAEPAAESAPAADIFEGERSEKALGESAAMPRQPAEPSIVPAEPETPPTMDSLPASVRAGLPEIQISVHYFATDPASRMVRVNGSILREGQEVGGLLVEEIRPDGIIFVYQGKKFLTNLRWKEKGSHL